MWRDGLHQPEHSLDLFSITVNSAAFSLPPLEHLIAMLVQGIPGFQFLRCHLS